MPSCTIVPEVTATSMTLEPQALPMVPMSTPWSCVHCDGDTTRRLGCIGNTQPSGPLGVGLLGALVPLVALTLRPLRVQFCSVLAVWAPTVPLAGDRLAACWKVITDCLVPAPKLPSSLVGMPTWVSHV